MHLEVNLTFLSSLYPVWDVGGYTHSGVGSHVVRKELEPTTLHSD